MSYGTSVLLDTPFADSVARVREALAAQGFGVLTEIDVTATLRARLGEQQGNTPLGIMLSDIDRRHPVPRAPGA